MLTKANFGGLKDGEIYKFTAQPIEQDLWGMNADNTKYLIYVKAFNQDSGKDDDLMLYASESIANKIKSLSSVTFTVKVSNVATTGGDLTVSSAE
ncbi:TPA: hypothetical protein U1246_001192 [Streptococcus suis]|uniref:hypothetical protein n=1 Tax=Streptococcus suis TaxID=1307 RepID=UPI000426CDC5|nr:hypothetical protein [Streptococcus suis]HEL1550289.1 hypothetical protein [Streptococcus suis]HEM5123289.1 hypothetical protein [Streptococcus suis]HEM6089739.1 hypothetical protein [Streptococcus suis]HEM6137500.1 hypothetical protein [Streptococcus suis]